MVGLGLGLGTGGRKWPKDDDLTTRARYKSDSTAACVWGMPKPRPKPKAEADSTACWQMRFRSFLPPLARSSLQDAQRRAEAFDGAIYQPQPIRSMSASKGHA